MPNTLNVSFFRCESCGNLNSAEFLGCQAWIRTESSNVSVLELKGPTRPLFLVGLACRLGRGTGSGTGGRISLHTPSSLNTFEHLYGGYLIHWGRGWSGKNLKTQKEDVESKLTQEGRAEPGPSARALALLPGPSRHSRHSPRAQPAQASGLTEEGLGCRSPSPSLSASPWQGTLGRGGSPFLLGFLL